MAAFYLDHNVSADVVDELARLGHFATTARAEHLDNAPDYLHVLHAARRQWTLLTHNGADFKLLHGAWLVWAQWWNVLSVPAHAGILIPPQNRWSEAELAKEVHQLVSHAGTLTNALYDWSPSKRWALWRPQQP